MIERNADCLINRFYLFNLSEKIIEKYNLQSFLERKFNIIQSVNITRKKNFM